MNQAAKAIHYENAKEFLGRPVVIDWAVNRKKFADHLKKAPKNDTTDDVSIKSEPDDDDDEDKLSLKKENSSDEDSDAADENRDEDNAENGDDDGSDTDEKKPIHKQSNDVAEGCTVFIKNVPFEATSDDLKKVCSQYGPLYYAVITTDKVSGHSKGTGFVKYRVRF